MAMRVNKRKPGAKKHSPRRISQMLPTWTPTVSYGKGIVGKQPSNFITAAYNDSHALDLILSHEEEEAAIQQAEDSTPVVEYDPPKVRLATDGGRPVKSEADYWEWLKEFCFTPKARKKNVVYLFHPDESTRLVWLRENTAVTVHGIPIGNLKRKTFKSVRVPVSWTAVKHDHIMRAANSRAECINNVHHTTMRQAKRVAEFTRSLQMEKQHAEPVIHSQLSPPVEIPPWVEESSGKTEATSSTDQAVQTQREQVAGFMEIVHHLRIARQKKLRQEHVNSSSFMYDVEMQRAGQQQYYERMKYIRGAGTNTAAGLRIDTVQHGKDNYYGRQCLHWYLVNHDGAKHTRYVDVRPLPDAQNSDNLGMVATPVEQGSIEQQIFAAMHPKHKTREFWNGPEPEATPPSYKWPSTEEILSRAEQRIAKENAERKAVEDAVLTQDFEGYDAMLFRSWLRGHANRGSPKFQRIMDFHVIRPMRNAASRQYREEARRNEEKYNAWLMLYHQREYSVHDNIFKHSVHARLKGSDPLKTANDRWVTRWKSTRKYLGRKLTLANNKGDLLGELVRLTKGAFLPSHAVTNQRPAPAG